MHDDFPKAQEPSRLDEERMLQDYLARRASMTRYERRVENRKVKEATAKLRRAIRRIENDRSNKETDA